MKKTVPFELFGSNQFIMFDILRLAELEKIMGVSIMKIVAEQDISVNLCINALAVGMQQHHRPDPKYYAEKIGEHLEKGGSLMDIAIPIIEAIAATGIFGNAKNEESDEVKNVKEGTE
ncbi:MAG TPA: hypothetical protein PLR73_09505 [Acetivibrio sp.]|nr:hypothetical protein [Acetivibrio sp.]